MNCTLTYFVNDSQTHYQLHKSSLRTGDTIILKTNNSFYLIKVLEEEKYTVSGGWFDKNNLSPATLTIHGCTWGGRALSKMILLLRADFILNLGTKWLQVESKKYFIFQILAITELETE